MTFRLHSATLALLGHTRFSFRHSGRSCLSAHMPCTSDCTLPTRSLGPDFLCLGSSRRVAFMISSATRSTSTTPPPTRLQLASTVDLKTRRLLGLCTLGAVLAGETLQEMLDAVRVHGIARVVDVFLLNPLDTMLPSFVLGVFPQRATPKHEVLVERWNVAHELLRKNGMCVLAHGGDGDSPQLAAMLARASVAGVGLDAGERVYSFAKVPSIGGGFIPVRAPAHKVDLAGLGLENVAVPVRSSRTRRTCCSSCGGASRGGVDSAFACPPMAVLQFELSRTCSRRRRRCAWRLTTASARAT